MSFYVSPNSHQSLKNGPEVQLGHAHRQVTTGGSTDALVLGEGDTYKRLLGLREQSALCWPKMLCFLAKYPTRVGGSSDRLRRVNGASQGNQGSDEIFRGDAPFLLGEVPTDFQPGDAVSATE